MAFHTTLWEGNIFDSKQFCLYSCISFITVLMSIQFYLLSHSREHLTLVVQSCFRLASNSKKLKCNEPQPLQSPWVLGASFHTIESRRNQIDQSNDDYCHFGDFGPNVGPELWGFRAKGKK